MAQDIELRPLVVAWLVNNNFFNLFFVLCHWSNLLFFFQLTLKLIAKTQLITNFAYKK